MFSCHSISGCSPNYTKQKKLFFISSIHYAFARSFWCILMSFQLLTMFTTRERCLFRLVTSVGQRENSECLFIEIRAMVSFELGKKLEKDAFFVLSRAWDKDLRPLDFAPRCSNHWATEISHQTYAMLGESRLQEENYLFNQPYFFPTGLTDKS